MGVKGWLGCGQLFCTLTAAAVMPKACRSSVMEWHLYPQARLEAS